MIENSDVIPCSNLTMLAFASEVFSLAKQKQIDLSALAEILVAATSHPTLQSLPSLVDALYEYLHLLECLLLHTRDPLSILRHFLADLRTFLDGIHLAASHPQRQEMLFRAFRLAGAMSKIPMIEQPSFASFFTATLPNSFALLLADAQRRSVAYPLICELLGLGCMLMQSAERFTHNKIFVFLLPPLYRRLQEYVQQGSPATYAIPNQLLSEIVAALRACLTKHYKVEHFLGSAIPLVLDLHPPQELGPPGKIMGQLSPCIRKIVSHLAMNADFLIPAWNYSAYSGFASKHFVEELPSIRALFKQLLLRGQRHQLQKLNDLFRQELLRPEYHEMRLHLFGTAGSRKLDSREFDFTIDIALILFNMISTSSRKHQERFNAPGSTPPDPLPENEDLALLRRLFLPLLSRLESLLRIPSSPGTLGDFKRLKDEILRMCAFRNIFSEQFNGMAHMEASAIMDYIRSRFPDQIIADAQISDAIQVLGMRLDHIQPKYGHVARLTSQLLTAFFDSNDAATLRDRRRRLEDLILHTASNQSIKDRLLGFGYSPTLWDTDLTMRVETDLRLEIDVEHFKTLLDIYQHYLPLLEKVGVQQVSLSKDREPLAVRSLFMDCTTLNQLRSRRALARKLIKNELPQLIDPKEIEMIQSHQLSLLATENSAEQKYLSTRDQLETSQKSIFWVRWNKSFFRSISCCGSTIVGCYAPSMFIYYLYFLFLFPHHH